jgi:uncharacterized protein (UPF0210 family)
VFPIEIEELLSFISTNFELLVLCKMTSDQGLDLRTITLSLSTIDETMVHS